MWTVSYQKLMALLLSSRYISEKDKKKDTGGWDSEHDFYNYLKTVENKYK
jgi:hypothetical protein